MTLLILCAFMLWLIVLLISERGLLVGVCGNVGVLCVLCGGVCGGGWVRVCLRGCV